MIKPRTIGLLIWLSGPPLAIAQMSPPKDLSLDASPAAGDGVTDDSAALNAYLARFREGGRVWVPVGKQYLIASANLLVPANVIIEGLSSPQSPIGAVDLSKASGFILTPNVTILMGSGSQLRDLFIRRAGLQARPSAEQVIAAVAQWGKERSIAVTIPPGIGGTKLSDLFVEGFNTCIKASAGQFSIQGIAGDCFNGLEVMSAGDNSYIDDVRFEPYYAFFGTSATSGAWTRPGIAFNLHDGNTGTFLTRIFSFMYANGVLLNNIGITQIANSGFEWTPLNGSGVTGTVGIRWINHNAGSSASNTYSLGFDTPISDEGTGEVMMNAIEAIASKTNATFNLGGRPAVPANLKISGPILVDSQVTTTFRRDDVGAFPVTVRQVAVVGDTGTTLALALAMKINSDQRLISSGIFASYGPDLVTIDWPSKIKVMVSAESTNGIIATLEPGSQPAGSSGEIIAANTIGADGKHPIYRFGPNVFSWHVDAPNTGDNILPANWIDADPTSFNRIKFTGVRWSAAPLLTNCGLSSSALSSTATDAQGTLTEGINATECTLHFRTAWPWTPECIVISVAGAPISSFVVTADKIQLFNPNQSGIEVKYRCSL